MILIDSVYINNSGGRTLLEYFIKEIADSENYFFLLDTRLPIESSILIKNKILVNPSEKSRKLAYREAFKLYNIETIFCFSNVPPPFKVYKCNVMIFLHNALLLKNYINCYSFVNRLKFKFKRIYIQFLNYSSYKWIVQTNTMKNSLLSSIRISEKNIYVFPFFQSNSLSINISSNRSNKFIYVADAVPQKNHQLLLETWKILASKFNLFPELLLTINKTSNKKLLNKIHLLKNEGININNIGILSSDLLLEKYEECEFLIYPSLIESFGLPLIEACEKDCNIIAANLDYVYDIVKPSFVFDPFNANNLANLIFDISTKNINIIKSKVVIKNKIFELINLINNNNV